MGLRSWVLLSMLQAAALAAQPVVSVTILDPAGLPAAEVQVQLKSAGGKVATTSTDRQGRAEFSGLETARYEIVILKEGFEAVKREVDLSAGQSIALDLTLVPALERKEKIEVRGTVDPIEQGSTVPNEAPTRLAKELPSRPTTVTDALPLIPGVVREPGGGIMISASPEHRSALIVNSADVTDPATGQFGLTVPIDSVETLNVFQTPYLAEFGRFTAGLVSVETRRGGEKWKWELNDPLPEFRIRSWHVRGLKTATPRLNFEGPLIHHKLYFSEGFEYEVRRTAVFTLPFPYNQKRQEGINSFGQLDWVQSEKHLVTATVHAAPRRMGYVNIDYFNPQPTSPDAGTHNYTGTLADHLSIFGGLLENTFSTTHFDARVWARGTEDLVITPTGNRGNYFAQKDRAAVRYSGTSLFSFAPIHGIGTHQLKMGVYMAGSEVEGSLSERPVDILDGAGRRIERISFTRDRIYDVDDTEYAFFGQDQWVITPWLALDLGVRTESQQVSGALRVAPRGGLAWKVHNSGTMLRGGFGLFYDRVPLNVYAFNRYPDQVITHYGADGEISEGPSVYLNTLGKTRVRFPFVFQRPIDGNFSPWSATWNVQLEQPVTSALRLRLGYLHNDADGLPILNSVAPDATSSAGSYLLEGAGRSRYRQLEATARLRLDGEREVFFSYVRSFARGDLNDFDRYLGTFPIAVIRENHYTNLPANLPHRFLAWGVVRLPRKFRVAPAMEYRSGFPYAVTDEKQNYVGIPNTSRYPRFLSIDTRLSKDLQVNPKYALRVSVSGFNLTNHFNPEAVHSNIADPVYGFFFGHRGRRFTADFDVLF